MPRRVEEHVDVRVTGVGVGLLVALDHPGHLAVDEDREAGIAEVMNVVLRLPEDR